MKKSYSRHPLMRTIAGVAAASMISLSIAQPVLAFDSMDGLTGGAKIYGLSFTGDFSFNKMSVNSFAYVPVDGMSGSYSDGGIVSFSNGMVKTDLPLFSYGDAVQYPGILYNHNGEQFFNHVVGAAEGNGDSQAVIWPYVLGGIVVVGGVAAIIISNNDDDEPTVDPVVATTTTTTTPTTTTTTTTPTTTTEPAPAPEPVPAPADGESDGNGSGGSL